MKELNHSEVEAARELVNAINKAGGAYHQLNLGQGLLIEGDYDLTQYLHHYNLPDRLDGKRVLDVGTSTGFFALEAARRGGQVAAIDIWPTGWPLEAISKMFELNVRYVTKSIYDLDPSFGSFDLVICGSLLLHLPDPLGAVGKIRSVCSGQAIIATACTADSATNSAPLCEFVGRKASDGDYYSYWALSGSALRQMCEVAGFKRMAPDQHFVLKTLPGRRFYSVPHVVVTAFV